MKRVVSTLLALVLVLALAGTAAAAGEGSITIDNAVNGKTYTIYRIFDLDSHNTDYTAINYKVSAKWAAFFAEGAEGLNYVDIDELGYVTWKENASAADFAAKAIAFATANSIANDGQKTADSSTVAFTGLELGYYLVQSDLGALCSLDTTMPDVEIQEKNSKPTAKKEVEEDSTGNYGDHNDADIGQKVNFRTTINVVDGDPKNYVLHDTMSAGLTFDPASVAVTIGERTLAKNTDYTLVTSNLTDGCTFEVQFKDGVLKPNDAVEVAYSAEVNEYAVIGGTGNDNKTQLKYGEDKGTEWDETHTYVWQFDVFKYAKKDKEEIPLAGAQFVLYKTVNDEKFYAQVANGKITGWTDDKEKATVFETPDNGKFVIAGLVFDSHSAGSGFVISDRSLTRFVAGNVRRNDHLNRFLQPVIAVGSLGFLQIVGVRVQTGDDEFAIVRSLENGGILLIVRPAGDFSICGLSIELFVVDSLIQDKLGAGQRDLLTVPHGVFKDVELPDVGFRQPFSR